MRGILLILLLGFGLTQPVVAQKRYGLNKRIDSLLTARYQRANIDTAYVIRPKTKWTLTARLNMSGSQIEAEGREQGHHYKSSMESDYKSTLSIGISYLGLSLNLSLNPAKILGKYDDYELNFRSYGKRFGFDIAYQDADDFKGWHDSELEGHIELPQNMLKLRTLNVNGYFIFNHRKFSYPAAFAHSYIQRRSAGSFMIAASGQGQHGEVSGDYPMDFKMTNIGIGAGYGYNYVPAKGWLLHISALPTFIVYSKTSLTIKDNKIPLDYHFPEVIITSRGAVVKQFGNKFAGISMVYNFTNIGDKDNLAVFNQKWLARVYFGLRL